MGCCTRVEKGLIEFCISIGMAYVRFLHCFETLDAEFYNVTSLLEQGV